MFVSLQLLGDAVLVGLQSIPLLPESLSMESSLSSFQPANTTTNLFSRITFVGKFVKLFDQSVAQLSLRRG